MVGLLEYFDIEEGMDLQLDMGHRDKAVVLMDAVERVSNFILDEQIEEW